MRTKKHHEDNMVFQDTFLKDVQKVYIGMLSNPFEIGKLTSISNTSYSFPDVVFDNISKLKETGKRLFDSFLNDRLIDQKVAIDAKIKKNQFILPGSVDPKAKVKGNDITVIKPATITKLTQRLRLKGMI